MDALEKGRFAATGEDGKMTSAEIAERHAGAGWKRTADADGTVDEEAPYAWPSGRPVTVTARPGKTRTVVADGGDARSTRSRPPERRTRGA